MPQLKTLFFFFFNDTATTEIYTLSLHDALPIFPAAVFFTSNPSLSSPTSVSLDSSGNIYIADSGNHRIVKMNATTDRKSTRLNSSHANISYAVFCLKKKTRQLSSSYQL